MNLSLEKLKPFGFNERELTETDFFEICERERIEVLELDIDNSFIMSAKGKSVIVISRKLKGLKRRFAMFHELAHYFLHGGRSLESAFFLGLLDTKNETEADAVATIAIVPRRSLECFSFLENHNNRYARKLFDDRQKIEFLYDV